jgi:hypothetical protein
MRNPFKSYLQLDCENPAARLLPEDNSNYEGGNEKVEEKKKPGFLEGKT